MCLPSFSIMYKPVVLLFCLLRIVSAVCTVFKSLFVAHNLWQNPCLHLSMVRTINCNCENVAKNRNSVSFRCLNLVFSK